MSSTSLPVKKVTVVLSDEADSIRIVLDTPSPFPTMGYAATAVILAEQDHGIEWVRRELGIEPEVINLRNR